MAMEFEWKQDGEWVEDEDGPPGFTCYMKSSEQISEKDLEDIKPPDVKFNTNLVCADGYISIDVTDGRVKYTIESYRNKKSDEYDCTGDWNEEFDDETSQWVYRLDLYVESLF
jgi:hypothetical protein